MGKEEKERRERRKEKRKRKKKKGRIKKKRIKRERERKDKKGGGACCADSQVLALGGAAQPLPGAGLRGGCSPSEAPGGTTAVAGPALEPWSQPPQ